MIGLASVLPEDPLRREVEAFAQEHALARRSRELDADPAFPWDEFRAMGRARLLGLTLPADRGGRGLPLRRAAVVLEELAFHAGTVFAKLALQPEFTSVLGERGGPDIRDRWFVPLLHGEALVSNQVTEPGAGSDLTGVTTRAVRSTTGRLLSGTKSQVAFAADASAGLVYGRDDGSDAGLTAWLVPQELPGVERRVVPDLGEHWMRRGTVTYRDVPLPDGARVGEPGRALDYLRKELTHERALLAAVYLGVARASWEETVAESARRVAFGRPISQHEAVAFPLVEDGTRLAAAWLYVEQTLISAEHGSASAGAAAMAKWLATEAALATLDHAVQFHGGRGYSRELPHEQRWRDVRSGSLAHGTDEVMHRVAARDLWPRPTG